MNLKYFKNFGVFFCSTKLDAVICTSLYLLLGVKMGGVTYSEYHTRYRPTLIVSYIISENTLFKILNIKQFINLNI